MPRPDVFSERKSSSMMTMGKRNFMGPGPVQSRISCANAGPRGAGRARAMSAAAGMERRELWGDSPPMAMKNVGPVHRRCSAGAAQRPGAGVPGGGRTLATTIAAAQTRRPTPSGVRRRRPPGRFFSADITAASASIQPLRAAAQRTAASTR